MASSVPAECVEGYQDVNANQINDSDVTANPQKIEPVMQDNGLGAQSNVACEEYDGQQEVLLRLSNFINNVIRHRKAFDDLCDDFLMKVEEQKRSDETAWKMAEMIINNAVEFKRFKCEGAKLAAKLASSVVFENFLANFLQRLEVEFKTTAKLYDTSSTDDSNDRRVRRFLNFLAEVFLRVKMDGFPIHDIGISFAAFLGRMLLESSTNAPFVWEMVQFTGRHLRDALSGNDKNVMRYNCIITLSKSYLCKHSPVSLKPDLKAGESEISVAETTLPDYLNFSGIKLIEDSDIE